MIALSFYFPNPTKFVMNPLFSQAMMLSKYEQQEHALLPK